ncbi:MAG: hypothetical protein R3B97_00135 [Dehalococcoidia bacterium]|nr:hypothetical protein [Dehalococcoidia bacterium]MCB9485372.1 hypothetical protein [Thermoflexaceae bacterium]
MKILPIILVVALAPVLLVSCGSDSKDDPAPAAASPVTPSGDPLTDEAYLKVFCTGVTNFRESLLTETRDGLVKVVQDYYDSMQAIVPPPDVATFHQEFLDYLKDALDEPTYLVTRDPPVPEASVRSRLAAAVSSVPECEYPTFLEGN